MKKGNKFKVGDFIVRDHVNDESYRIGKITSKNYTLEWFNDPTKYYYYNGYGEIASCKVSKQAVENHYRKLTKLELALR